MRTSFSARRLTRGRRDHADFSFRALSSSSQAAVSGAKGYAVSGEGERARLRDADLEDLEPVWKSMRVHENSSQSHFSATTRRAGQIVRVRAEEGELAAQGPRSKGLW